MNLQVFLLVENPKEIFLRALLLRKTICRKDFLKAQPNQHKLQRRYDLFFRLKKLFAQVLELTFGQGLLVRWIKVFRFDRTQPSRGILLLLGLIDNSLLTMNKWLYFLRRQLRHRLTEGIEDKIFQQSFRVCCFLTFLLKMAYFV